MSVGIQFVYFVGRNSIFFGCVSVSVVWVLLLSVKCCKEKTDILCACLNIYL